MTEIEPVETRSPLGNALIDMGNVIERLSAREVDNKKVIIALGVVGLAGLALLTCQSLEGDRLIRAADRFHELAENASIFGDHSSSIRLYTKAIESRLAGTDKYSDSVATCVMLGTEFATVMGIQVVNALQDKEMLFEISGTTKVSTSVGPILASIFKGCGQMINAKTT